MKEITFSTQSTDQLKHFSLLKRIELIEKIAISFNLQENKSVRKIIYKNRTFFRLRLGEYRIYFEKSNPNRKHILCIFNKNSFADFAVRIKLATIQEVLIEEHPVFLKHLEQHIQNI